MDHIKDLIAHGDRLHADRAPLLSFWQDAAEQFAPDMADFTKANALGTDYASDLVTSYPLLIQRELSDQFGMMLRPSAKDAAVMYVEGLKDYDGKRWLEEATARQRREMYNRKAQYTVAAKQRERDLATFGNAVVSIEVKPDKSSLLYRRWHLRDVVWADDYSGDAECVHRNWYDAPACVLAAIFGRDRLHHTTQEHLQPGKDRYTKVKVRHIVVPTSMYDGPTKFKTKFVSLFIEVDTKHEIQVTGQNIMPYNISRWQRVGGSQYALSPAVMAGLPEARLLQAMTFTLLEAGEKHARPPLLATENAIRGDINVRAGDVTWVSQDYDERTGEVLRPLTQDKSGMPLGLEMQQRAEQIILKAFYVDKLRMPPSGGANETAYEVSKRIEQYIREALPLIEPLEFEVNGGDHEITFALLMREGVFGAPNEIPQSLSGADVDFKFSSPLRESKDRQKGQIFLQGVEIIQAAAALDPSVASIPNAKVSVRSVLEGIGYEMEWLHSPEEVQAAANAEAEQAKAQQMLDAMEQASGIAKNFSGTQAAEQM